MKPVSLSEARIQGLKRYFTGEPCKHGHVAERQTSNKTCVVCAASRSPSPATQAKDAERKRHWYLSRRDQEIERRQRYYIANKERLKAAMSNYRAARRTEQAIRRRAHYEANKPRYIAQARARSFAVTRAMPAWANPEAIAMFYAEAARLTLETDTKHQVDHEIPLRGETVCGLHVENNLQILTATQNAAKKNKWEGASCES